MGKSEVDNEPNPRVRRALHRFTEQLDVEVQKALAAARARQLAPLESVLQRCRYLQARHVTPEPIQGLPKRLVRKPDELVVTADLAAGLKAVEPHLLDACVQQLQAAVERLRPFEGRPFGRKPLAVASVMAGKRTQSPADEEDQALEQLERAAAELL